MISILEQEKIDGYARRCLIFRRARLFGLFLCLFLVFGVFLDYLFYRVWCCLMLVGHGWLEQHGTRVWVWEALRARI